MNKKLALLFAPALLISTTSMASNIQMSVGGKAWLNTWENIYNGSSVESNAVMMIGPSAQLRSGNFFAGASYLISLNDYEFENGGRTFFSMDRADINLVSGFMFNPRLGVYGGYKLINGSRSDGAESDWSGLGFGITGNLPINDQFSLFGSFGLQYLTEEYSNGYSSGESDLDGTVFELGASMVLSSSMFASVSYKRQSYEYDNGSELVFGGLAASINMAL